METEPDARFLRSGQVAALLGVPEDTLSTWRRDRANLPFHRFGHGVYYDREDVAALISRSRVEIAEGAE
jgi:hypothetical protein